MTAAIRILKSFFMSPFHSVERTSGADLERTREFFFKLFGVATVFALGLTGVMQVSSTKWRSLASRANVAEGCSSLSPLHEVVAAGGPRTGR